MFCVGANPCGCPEAGQPQGFAPTSTVLFLYIYSIEKGIDGLCFHLYHSYKQVGEAIDSMALETPADLPPDLANEIAAMALFTDDALWSASKASLSPAQQYRLRQLTQSSQEQRLTDAESSELESLLEQYDIAVLRRAHALALLSQRGYPLPDQSNYLVWRDETFDHESVDSLSEKIVTFQQQNVDESTE